MWVRLSKTDICPISPYPKWLGVVVKAEEHGSVRCRVLNGSNGSFPLSLVVILSSVFFFIDIDILDFFPNCSYIFFALPSRGTSNMPRTETSSAVSQDYLDFYYLSSAILLLGSSLGPQCKNGSGPQIIDRKSVV